jgi:gliding motility-associated-like protein
MKQYILGILFVLGCFNVTAQITINTTNTPTQLVDGVLVPTGSGTVISNVIFRGVYTNGGKSQIGQFSTATTTLAQMGFSSGVVLATGNVVDIPLPLGNDPGASQWTSTGFGSCTTGEVRETGTCATTNTTIVNDLNTLAGPLNFFNAAILEFDFVPVENSVVFRYIFGSEEYNDSSNSAFDTNYNCSEYNDKFGFLISGTGILGGQGYDNNARNIARLANGSEVSINSVNDGIVGSSASPQGASYCIAANGAWTQNTPSPEFLGTIDGTELNGNTRILTASQTGLTPGDTYHIKLIILDIRDNGYDSVVYLEAGSFTTEFSCNAGPDQALCAATSTTLAASSPATGSWSLVSGTGTFVSNTDPNTVVNGLSVGPNVFRWTATDLSCFADVTITVTAAPAQPPVVDCWDNFVFNTGTCSWDNTGSQPVQPPVVDCWDNFVFNTSTCSWDNTGSQPVQPPVVNCWDNFVFNTGTCSWDNTGSQPAQPPVVDCWDNFVFNTGTCSWDNTGSQPVQPPVVDCWDNFVFNIGTCSWDNTGSQPAQPPVVNCWDNFVFNTGTCSWDNTGSQPVQPPVVDCWDNFVFNTGTCSWDNTGSQPAQPPVVDCWDNFVFNTGTCSWDNTGSQPVQPPVVNCWDNFVFNTGTCSWDNTGSQPVQPPVVDCWDNFVFNTGTCSWNNTGSQPAQPPVVDCWDNFVFNTGTCSWDNTGSQPAQPPVVDCWDNFVFNTGTCSWDNTGSQPAQPPVVDCWDNFVFNTGTCSWNNTGSQPVQPPVVNCWDNFVFNTGTCSWDNTGSQPAQPPVVNCWDNFVFNTGTCSWDNTGSQPAQPPVVDCWDNFVFNTGTCSWDNTGSQPSAPTGLACYETAVFNNTTCVWDVTGSPTVINISSGCNGVDFELSASLITNATYEWYDFNGNLIGSDSSVIITTEGTYEVQVSLNGCVASEFVTINNIFCSIPKGVSPNGDGLNDTWDLSNLNVQKVQIFNRYGVEIYTKDNYLKDWDGKSMNGNELPSATYYYVLSFSNGTVKTGWVYLNRED